MDNWSRIPRLAEEYLRDPSVVISVPEIRAATIETLRELQSYATTEEIIAGRERIRAGVVARLALLDAFAGKAHVLNQVETVAIHLRRQEMLSGRPTGPDAFYHYTHGHLKRVYEIANSLARPGLRLQSYREIDSLLLFTACLLTLKFLIRNGEVEPALYRLDGICDHFLAHLQARREQWPWTWSQYTPEVKAALDRVMESLKPDGPDIDGAKRLAYELLKANRETEHVLSAKIERHELIRWLAHLHRAKSAVSE